MFTFTFTEYRVPRSNLLSLELKLDDSARQRIIGPRRDSPLRLVVLLLFCCLPYMRMQPTTGPRFWPAVGPWCPLAYRAAMGIFMGAVNIVDRGYSGPGLRHGASFALHHCASTTGPAGRRRCYLARRAASLGRAAALMGTNAASRRVGWADRSDRCPTHCRVVRCAGLLFTGTRRRGRRHFFRRHHRRRSSCARLQTRQPC